jgi:cephalosporin hydroxylase
VSVDIVAPRVAANRRVTFLEGDLRTPAEVLGPSMLASLPHPWCVIDDAHANVVGVLHYLDPFIELGDHVVIEDTCAPAKYRSLRKLMTSDFGRRYHVDTSYTDRFGYNGTWNWNGYLRKVASSPSDQLGSHPS